MAWNPGEGWLRPPLNHKGENFELGFKNRKVKFRDEVENTLYAKDRI